MSSSSRISILFLVSAVYIVMTILLPKYFNDYSNSSGARMTYPKPLSVAQKEENIIKMIKEQESTEFWIKTQTCMIPKTPMGKKSTSKKKLNCGSLKPLTEVHGLSIKLFPERLSEYKDAKGVKEMSCSYQGIVRIQQDPNKFTTKSDELQKLKPAVEIKEKVTPIEEDGVQVSCSVIIDKKKKVIYKNVHTFFQPSKVNSKLDLFKNSGGWSSSPDVLNVMLVGIDSISRINLMRHMPKTYKFLTEEASAIDFLGYNKVEDNTDPNLCALLMGWSWEYFGKQKICHKKFNGKFDDCPLIWKNFSSSGYLTSYSEDAPHMGIFHYSNQNGWVIQPTDYYNRPFFLMSEKFIGHDGGYSKQTGHRCQGTRASFDVVNDWNIQLFREMKDVPKFSLTWSASTTHDNMEDARLLDDSFSNYFRNIKEEGYFDNTVLAFISDHGMRFGKHRQTYPGMMEERLPYFLLVLPPSFKEKYPVSWNNINLNKDRLVTHFDLHSTLLAVANQDYAKPSQSDYATTYGQSLFKPIPLNRTCKDVGIIEHYCTCSDSEELDPSSSHAYNAAVAALDHINTLLKYYMECSQLQLYKVTSARLRKPNNSTTTFINKIWVVKFKKKVEHSVFYLVSFETIPGNAVFESTVKNPEGEKIVSDVSRINLYGNQSHCIANNNMKKFCYCNDLLH